MGWIFFLKLSKNSLEIVWSAAFSYRPRSNSTLTDVCVVPSLINTPLMQWQGNYGKDFQPKYFSAVLLLQRPSVGYQENRWLTLDTWFQLDV